MGPVLARLKAADAALIRIETLVEELKDPYARNRVFTARDALSIINRPFGEDPILPSPPS